MLKGIPKIISPELLKILDEMGHGDEIVLADGNFPGESVAQRCVRADGHGTVELLKAILKLFPLDTYAKPLYVMEKVPGDTVETPIIDEYKLIVKPYTDAEIEGIERFAFYERAKKAYAVIMSGESALYANIILKKGVVTE
ncbi:MAG: L-fucose mutarotase [Clostridia bacterium]|nr:L-fucose mutarotase [Clostridia bacterium]